ncbi:MAG: thioredoxin, partial [Methylobacterium organophilum]|nr:thioredoxin [Methylobacterium organophilum]
MLNDTLAAGGAPAGDTGSLIKDTTTASFRQDVIAESMHRPVLVDFWAPWCGPCKQLTPVLEKVVREAAGAVVLAKMNIDEHPSIAGQLGIQSIPAVIVFQKGQPVDGFMGAVPESQIKELIGRVAGPQQDPLEAALADAAALIQEGDLAGAAEIYAAVLEQQPDNVTALAGLAKMQLDAGEIENAKRVLAMVPEAKAGDPALVGIR